MWLQHSVISLKYPISFLYWTDLAVFQFFCQMYQLKLINRQIWESLQEHCIKNTDIIMYKHKQ